MDLRTGSGSLHAPITAGGNTTSHWDNFLAPPIMPDRWVHAKGPFLTYLARCPGDSCEGFDGSGDVWFKIDQAGLKSEGKDLRGPWYQDSDFSAIKAMHRLTLIFQVHRVGTIARPYYINQTRHSSLSPTSTASTPGNPPWNLLFTSSCVDDVAVPGTGVCYGQVLQSLLSDVQVLVDLRSRCLIRTGSENLRGEVDRESSSLLFRGIQSEIRGWVSHVQSPTAGASGSPSRPFQSRL